MTAVLGEIKSNPLLESFEALLSYHFGNVERSTIEKLSSKSLDDIDINTIKKISKEMHLECEFHKITPKQMQKHQFPAILLTKDAKSAIFVLKIENNIATIQYTKDAKPQALPLSKLKIYNRVLLIYKKDKEIETLDIDDKKSKSWFFTPIKKEWRSYVEIGILTIFINIFGLALPLFTMNVYNRVIPNFATETLVVLAFSVGLILVFDILLKSARLSILDKVTIKLSNYFEEELFKKLLSIDSAYDHYHIGTKTNLLRELSMVKDFFATKIVSLLDLPFFFLATLVIYLISPVMAIVPVVGAVLSFAINYVMQYPIAKLHKQNFKGSQSKQAYLVEQLHGSEAIKLANALPKRVEKWRRVVNFYNEIQAKMQFMSGATTFVSYSILQAVSLFSVVVGVYVIHEGALSVGGLIAITILSARAMAPVIALSNTMIRYAQVKDALESLNNYWHLPSETQKYIEMGIGKVRGEIEFEDVSFSYPHAKYPTIQNISFKIKSGERVAIVGQTGAGKSTIQKLLTGILKPQSGKIYIDNIDISSLHPVELRENIALMPQEPYIFSGTLKENLELNRSISKAKMSEIIQKSGLSSLVKKVGSADDFQVGENGSNLSVGQRHLVALARALMDDSPILILDEPTTGLDIGLERSLVSHLNQSLDDKTLIVITHRLAALDLVDRIILINDGKLIADDTKEKVLEMLKGSVS